MPIAAIARTSLVKRSGGQLRHPERVSRKTEERAGARGPRSALPPLVVVAAVLVVAAVVLEPQPVRPTPCEQRSALVDSLGHTHMSQHEKFGFYIQKIAFRLTHSA